MEHGVHTQHKELSILVKSASQHRQRPKHRFVPLKNSTSDYFSRTSKYKLLVFCRDPSVCALSATPFITDSSQDMDCSDPQVKFFNEMLVNVVGHLRHYNNDEKTHKNLTQIRTLGPDTNQKLRLLIGSRNLGEKNLAFLALPCQATERSLCWNLVMTRYMGIFIRIPFPSDPSMRTSIFFTEQRICLNSRHITKC
jgi:hypothetical protein